MIGSFITRGLILALGYLYPAYECYKAVEKPRPDMDQLRFWSQYWIIMAAITVSERVADVFVAWIPMYCEAKLAFIVYLWYEKTQGTTYIYQHFLRPQLSKHEPEVDRHLHELKTRAGDVALQYWRLGYNYAYEKVLMLLTQGTLQPPAQKEYRPPPPPPRDYGRRNRTKFYSEEDNLEYEVVEPNEPEPMDAPEYATPSPLSRKVRQRTSRQY
jgi:receptor expression-enhancing protein 1/2/3/4